jgi:2'-5' RNA ligase superfamily
MHGIVSLLPEKYYRRVESLWDELEREFSVRGVYITPFPHFSYNVAQHYEVDKVLPVLKRITSNITTFQVRTSGIGIFNGASPVIYIPVVRSLELSQLHEELWNELSTAGTGIQEYYSPAQWMPHITIGFGDINRDNLPTIVRWLNERDFTWEFTVDNLAFIHDTGVRQELHSRYDIRNEPVPGESSMERLQMRHLL